MGIEIVNYSFHPVTEYAKKMGIVKLDEDVNERLKQHFEFKFPPTHREIRDRCNKIVQHALENDHTAVFIRNFETFQSFLIQEFQNNGIRVFLPYYLAYRYTESQAGYDLMSSIAYLNINEIIEIPPMSYSLFYLSSIELVEHDSEFKIVLLGYLGQVPKIKYELISGSLIQILEWSREFISQFKANKIQDILFNKFNLRLTDYKYFASELIKMLGQIQFHLISTNTELGDTNYLKIIENAIGIVKIISIIDSEEVQEYLAISDYAIKEYDREDDFEIQSIEKAINIYLEFDDVTKDVINLLGTKSLIKFDISRLNQVKYNLAYQYRALGYFYMIRKKYVLSKESLEKSISLYNRYDANEIDEREIEAPLANLITTNIFLGDLDIAETLTKDKIKQIPTPDVLRRLQFEQKISLIHRKRKDYGLAIANNLNLLELIRERDVSKTYQFSIEIQNSINYYLLDDIENSLICLQKVISDTDKPQYIKKRSMAAYLYNLIIYQKKNTIDRNLLLMLENYRDHGPITDSQFRYIEILDLLLEKKPNDLIISKLTEVRYLHPDDKLNALLLESRIYLKLEKWTELEKLISIIRGFQQLEYYPELKHNLCLIDYLIGLLTGKEKSDTLDELIDLESKPEIDWIAELKNKSKNTIIELIRDTLVFDLIEYDLKLMN